MDIYSSKIGDKIIFNKVGPFWFTDMVENGKKLEQGRAYTIKSKNYLSSWTKITLEETGDECYSLGWFEIGK